MKSGNLNFREPSGPLQACNGTDLPFYLTNGTIFLKKEKKKIAERKMCVLTFSTRFVRNISHTKRNERNMIKNVNRSSCKVRFFLSDLNGFCILSTDFRKKLKLMKIRPVGAHLFHADRRRDGRIRRS